MFYRIISHLNGEVCLLPIMPSIINIIGERTRENNNYSSNTKAKFQ